MPVRDDEEHDEEHMDHTTRSPPPKDIWAYAYQITPPQSAGRLVSIRTVLDQEHAKASRAERIWAAHIVLEPDSTHILVVSDSPEQSGVINRKLEAELHGLEAVFSLTATLRVVDEAAPKPATAGHPAAGPH